MELFALYGDGAGIRAKFLVHLSDFATGHSTGQGQVDGSFLEQCVTTPEEAGYFFPHGEDIFGIKVRGFSSIGKFLATRRVLRFAPQAVAISRPGRLELTVQRQVGSGNLLIHLVNYSGQNDNVVDEAMPMHGLELRLSGLAPAPPESSLPARSSKSAATGNARR